MPASPLPLFSQSCQNGLLQNVARPHVIPSSKPSMASLCAKNYPGSWHALGGFCDLPPPPSFLLLPDHTCSFSVQGFILMYDLLPYLIQVFAQTAPPQRGLPEDSVPALHPPQLSLLTALFWSISLCRTLKFILNKKRLVLLSIPPTLASAQSLASFVKTGAFSFFPQHLKGTGPPFINFCSIKRMNIVIFFLQS